LKQSYNAETTVPEQLLSINTVSLALHFEPGPSLHAEILIPRAISRV
jgi:hypothetical protein